MNDPREQDWKMGVGAGKPPNIQEAGLEKHHPDNFVYFRSHPKTIVDPFRIDILEDRYLTPEGQQ